MSTDLKQLTTKERARLRKEMRKEQGAAQQLAKQIGIGRATLYNAIDEKYELSYMPIDKIRKFLNSQKVA